MNFDNQQGTVISDDINETLTVIRSQCTIAKGEALLAAAK